MNWDLPLQPGFKSKLQQWPYMMLINLLNCFRNSVRRLPMDLTCFEMSVEYGTALDGIWSL
eukprot:11491299-Alexandrium_andersonii.AAC.1